MTQEEAQALPSYDVREYLAELIERLDELDEVDYFGHEGWRRMLMGDR